MASLRGRIAAWRAIVSDVRAFIRLRHAPWFLRFVIHRDRSRLEALRAGIALHELGHGDLWRLRRNIHRLEKGLIHKVRKAVFAADYIGETVDLLGRVRIRPSSEAATIAWAEAVLVRYFATCEPVPDVAAAHGRFAAQCPENVEPSWQPYAASTRPALSVDYSDLLQLAERRRSIRFYSDVPVPFDLVGQAMRVASLSPSSCNRQAFKFLYYDEESIVARLAGIPGGLAGYQVPAIVVVIGRYRAYFDERDVKTPVVDASLATMAFILALETLGLSSVCINWPALPDREAAIRRLIALEPDEFVVMLIGVGYADPAGRVPYSAKRELGDLLARNAQLTDREQA